MDSNIEERKLEFVTYIIGMSEKSTIEHVIIVRFEQEYMKAMEKRKNGFIDCIFPGWYDKELDDETNFKRYNIYTGTHKTKICAQCGLLHNPKKCSRRKMIAYCSIDCQKIHWKNLHKDQCKPFTTTKP